MVRPVSMSSSDYSLAQSILDGVDEAVAASERSWGVGRLRLLVDDDLRARWDRQWQAWCAACEAYDLAGVRAQGAAVRRALGVLEAAARGAGHGPIQPAVWEVEHQGRVIAVCRTAAEAHAVAADGRRREVWTVEELVRVALSGQRAALSEVKRTFPGCEVTALRTRGPIDWAAGGDELPPDLVGIGG
jgi:hypothetical protein